MMLHAHGVRRTASGVGSGAVALTLIELLVVLGILGCLAMLLIPTVSHARAVARTNQCAANLKSIGTAFTSRLEEKSGYLPDAYYTFAGRDGVFQVTLNGPDAGRPDGLLSNDLVPCLACPTDDKPASVLGQQTNGAGLPVACSYAYNVALPLMFRNISRVVAPSNTVTFYDGDPTTVIGTWKDDIGWARDTIRYRHQNQANFLYMDGHVETEPGFPDIAFEGGDQWRQTCRNNPAPKFSPALSAPPPPEDKTVKFKIANGTVIPQEDCDATVTCVGAAFQYGAGGPRIPVSSYYFINGGAPVVISADTTGGEAVNLPNLSASTSIGVSCRTTKYISARYASNDNSGHTWVLRNGDAVPSIAGYDHQRDISQFLAGYIDATGHVTIGPSDAIFLFEISSYTDYTRYSCADFQDLVVLVSLKK